MILALLLAASLVPMPDPALTPGVVDPAATKEVICRIGYTKDARHVTQKTKCEVLARYGHDCSAATRKLYEIDHLISLELGGLNTVENLWPQPWLKPGAREKDIEETNFHRRVCAGEMDLADAQQRIVKDWYAEYLLIVKSREVKP